MCETSFFKIVSPNKLGSGKSWGDFFKKCQCSGSPFEGKAASESFLKRKQLLEELFVLQFFRFSRFGALLGFLVFLGRFGLPRFRLSAASKPCSTGAASFQSLVAGPTTRRTFCAPAFLRIARVWGAGLAPPIVATSSQFSTSGMVTFSAGGTNSESADWGPPHLPGAPLLLFDWSFVALQVLGLVFGFLASPALASIFSNS